ncbi:MAG TPA: Crp/Fnr family transcriptional regulator [Anaeromyxobacteraceae bacterium]|nr:Crp/Fnr family transcriptional regulator [Anaeromyxobacteraceae bacterium]
MLSTVPVSDCSSCSLGIASQGRCRFTPSTREAGATLCAQGERPRTVYFVKEGFVALSAVSPKGAELVLTLRGPTSLLCTEALNSEPSPYEVRALSRVKLCGLSGDAMNQWIGPERSPARVVLELLLAESKMQRDEVNFRQGDCLSRVARFALAHAKFLADRPNAVRKQVVARLLGMRPETLSRCLTRLEKDGVLDASRGVRVIDQRRLAAIAMEDVAA